MRFKASVVLAMALPAIAGAQATDDSLSLAGRSNIMFAIGLTGERTTNASGGGTSVRSTGEAGGFSFNHWVRPEVGVTISANVLGASTSAGFGSASTNAIVPLLFGISYSPRALALSRSIRPYASVAAGPYIHTVSDANGLSASNYTETAAGSRLAAGANWFIARHFAMNVEAHYNAVGKFDRQDAVTKDPSGFGFNLGFAFGWGGKH